MIVEGLVQRTPEWYTMRAGMVTGSRVADVVAKLKKGGYAACRQNYLMEVVCSRITGLMPDHFVSAAMEFGMENEPFARAAYEMEFDTAVEDVGLAIHSDIKWFASSPDGLIGTDGVIEIKCPNTATHLDYILAGEVPEDYKPQMLAEMACTGRKWCDFVSFDPRLPKNLQLFVRRYERDDARIADMETEVAVFLAEVANVIERLELAVMR